MSTKKKATVRFSIDVPAELNEQLEQEAELQKRSKSQQVNWIVEKYYETEKPEIPVPVR